MTPIQAPLKASIADAVLKLKAEALRFTVGELSKEEFHKLRAAQGLYEQRNSGSFLLRVKHAAGLVSLDQLQGIAKLALAHGVSRLHVTTRQDLQLYDLSLEAALQVQACLFDLNLTSYGTGGNNLRNVASDPLSGLLSDDEFDVLPYALAVAAHYEGANTLPPLPRKFKIAFSASAADSASASTADLGFIAKRRGGELGFQVFVAGGLGLGAAIGLELFPWLDAAAIAPTIRGLLSLFATHGDHVNRHKARLRHLRKRLGDDAFLQLCHQTIASTPVLPGFDFEQVTDGLPPALPTPPSPLPGRLQGRAGIIEEREPGRFCVRLAPVNGDLTPKALSTLTDVAAKFAAPWVRIGFEQELWLTGIGGNAIEHLLTSLRGQGLGTPDERSHPIVACSGAATCRLGLLRSRDAAIAIEQLLHHEQTVWNGEAIRISGCPNACGRHLVAQLGFEGRSKRVGDRSLPCYAVFYGGVPGSANARLASNVGTIPAKRLPELVVALSRLDKTEVNSTEPPLRLVETTVASFARLPEPVPEEWFLDWGKTS